MIQTDYSLIWLFFMAAVAVASVAVYEWWKKRDEKPHPEKDWYAEGLNLIIADRPREAIQALAEALRYDTDNIDAYLKLGMLLRKLGKPRRAAQIHLELSIRADLTNEASATAFCELALDMEQLGNLDRAHKYLDKARSHDTSIADEPRIRLRLLEKQGKWKEASETAKRLDAITGQKDPARLALYKIEEALAISDSGKEHDARLVLKEALKIDPKAVEVELYIASSYIREERQDDAFEWLTKFVKAHPERAHEALPLLEPLLYDLGRFGEVEVMLLVAAEKAPENTHLAVALIDIAEKKGELEAALDRCERALESIPHDLPLKIKRLALLKARNQAKEAAKRLDELIGELSPVDLGFFCSKCGFHSELLRTRCPDCGSFRSFTSDRRKERT